MDDTLTTFSCAAAISLDDVRPVSGETLAGRACDLMAGGWRLLTLFGLPGEAGGVGLCAVLAHDGDGRLAALRTGALEAFPALTPDCPQAHLFEREIFEQWGLRPEGHPWCKPVRRIPDAAEAHARNVAEGRAAGEAAPPPFPFFRAKGGEVHEVAVGPVHAGVIEPGHFRFQCYGENVLHLEIALGYQHRGLEAMLTRGPLARCLPLLECAAGDTSVGHATAHCVLLERLTGREVSQRAWLLRRVGLELERLANHTGDLGAMGGDTGFLPTASWNGRIRGDFLNLTAAMCGNRFGRGLLRVGGVGQDLDPALCADMQARLAAAGRDARGSVDVLLRAHSVLERFSGTGVVREATARQLGMVGVAARASGLAVDARHTAPLPGPPCPAWEIRCEHTGDVLARALVRSRELDDSLRMVAADLEALAALPADAAALAPRGAPRPLPRRLAVAQVEGWRGEICHVAVTGGDGQFLAYKVVDPSFRNWAGLAMALRGNQISDFPLCNKSFNLSYCGHDL